MTLPSTTPRINEIERKAYQTGYQNAIINGNFDFWQRGTSVSLTTSLLYQADRFSASRSATWTGTYARVTDAPTIAQSGFASTYSLRITNGTGASPGSTDTYLVRHPLEGYDFSQFHRGSGRLQFWVKSSVTGTFVVNLQNSASDRSYVVPYTITQANTWEKKVIDITFDTSGTWLLDNGLGLIIQWALSVGSSRQTSSTNQWIAGDFRGATGMTQWAVTTGATFQLSQVMLTPGTFDSSTNLTFKRCGRSLGHELELCQRYYEKSYPVDVPPGDAADNYSYPTYVTYGGFPGSNRGTFPIRMRVVKRANPTITYWTPAGTSGQVNKQDIPGLSISTNACTAAEIGTTQFHSDNSGYTNSTMYRVWGHYTADSEL